MRVLHSFPKPQPRRLGQVWPVHGVNVFQDTLRVVTMRAGANIDVDGAPTAYSLIHPALDVVADAGWPNGWGNVLIADPENPAHPFVDSDGYFVSSTSYRIPGYPVTDHRAWLDASKVPYAVINPIVRKKCRGIILGCMVYVSCNGVTVEMVCGDVSGPNSIGEISAEGARRLGIPDSAIDGGIGSGVSYAFHCDVPAVIDGVQYELQAA